MVTKLEKLVGQFARGVANQTDSIWRGEQAGRINKFARQYVDAFNKLRAHGDAGRDALTALLKHERPDVRGMAAACLLRYRTVEATAILRELAQGQSLVAFEAGQALKRWEEGTWSLDPPDT